MTKYKVEETLGTYDNDSGKPAQNAYITTLTDFEIYCMPNYDGKKVDEASAASREFADRH